MAHWLAEFKQLARAVALGLLGQVWRRLVHFYMSFPWLLVSLADPDVPLHVKLNIADLLFAVPEETLDPHFSLEIKKMAGEPEKLLGEFCPDVVVCCIQRGCHIHGLR